MARTLRLLGHGRGSKLASAWFDLGEQPRDRKWRGEEGNTQPEGLGGGGGADGGFQGAVLVPGPRREDLIRRAPPTGGLGRPCSPAGLHLHGLGNPPRSEECSAGDPAFPGAELSLGPTPGSPKMLAGKCSLMIMVFD